MTTASGRSRTKQRRGVAAKVEALVEFVGDHLARHLVHASLCDAAETGRLRHEGYAVRTTVAVCVGETWRRQR